MNLQTISKGRILHTSRTGRPLVKTIAAWIEIGETSRATLWQLVRWPLSPHQVESHQSVQHSCQSRPWTCLHPPTVSLTALRSLDSLQFFWSCLTSAHTVSKNLFVPETTCTILVHVGTATCWLFSRPVRTGDKKGKLHDPDTHRLLWTTGRKQCSSLHPRSHGNGRAVAIPIEKSEAKIDGKVLHTSMCCLCYVEAHSLTCDSTTLTATTAGWESEVNVYPFPHPPRTSLHSPSLRNYCQELLHELPVDQKKKPALPPSVIQY